ncbi:MAG TPA: hypothetical protein DCQ12_05400 [Candidatus Cloacimonas sp.]|nr:hypothetical protein [Candidatus Cloacimonas sp.]
MNLLSKTKKKSLKPVNYRQKIMDAAIRVFARKGYNDTTMIDVARAAKVGIGTFYNYFKNKDELLISSADKTIETELGKIRKICEKQADPMDRMGTYFIQHAMLLKENPHIARFLVSQLRQSEGFFERNPEFNPLRHYVNFVKELFETAKESGRIKDVDTKALAIMVIGSMDMLICQWLIEPESVDSKAYIHNIRTIMAHGIRPAGL